MRILVTGGAGFIGSNYVQKLLSEPNEWSEVVVLDSLTYAGNLGNLASVVQNPRFRFVQGDIRDESLVAELIRDTQVVVHFAAESHVDRSIQNPNEFVSTNVLGTNNLLRVCLEIGIEKFIHVSTDEVYGSIEVGSWNEDSPVSPNSPYSASKASSDMIALSYFRTFGLPVVVTRCSNNYGRFQYPEKLIPLAVTNLIEGIAIPIYGDGSNSRDWLDVRDHCHAIDLVVSRGRLGETYNIGGGEELSNLQLVHKLLSIFGLGDTYINFVSDRKGHDKRYSVSYEKIAAECGYKPRHDFENSLEETVHWYRSNEDWWRPLKTALAGK